MLYQGLSIVHSEFAMQKVIQLQIPTQLCLSELPLALIVIGWIPWEADSKMEISVHVVYYRFIGINTLERKWKKLDFSEEDKLDSVSPEASVDPLREI